MKASLGVPKGRKGIIYHPELFNDHEEVIIYPREEFRRNYLNIRSDIKTVFLRTSNIYDYDNLGERLIMGQWFELMKSVNLIEKELSQFTIFEPSQSYLDAHLFSEISVIEEGKIKNTKYIEVGSGKDLLDNIIIH